MIELFIFVFDLFAVRCLIVLWTKMPVFLLKVHFALKPEGMPVSRTTLKDPLPVSNFIFDQF